MAVQFSRSATRRTPGLGARSLKTQQHAALELALGAARSGRHFGSRSDRPARSRPTGPRHEAGALAAPARDAPAAERPLQSWSFPRKEVIQPHLPVRLPCYDFTPVTSPTFDGSLPKGVGHRLRVLLASVV